MHQASTTATAQKYPTGVPRGFEEAFRNADVPELPGYLAVNAATFATPPEVYDMQGRLLSPAEYSRMFYAGAKVQAVLTPRVYDAKGNRGAGFWLGGVLIVDASAPKLSIASGMSSAEVRNAFGLPASPLGGGAAVVPPAQPAAVAAPAPVSSPQPPAPAGIAAPATTYPSSPAPVAVVPNPGILAAPPAPAPVAPAAPVRTMTPAAVAAGYTYEALAAAGWSDQQMIQGGYLAPM